MSQHGKRQTNTPGVLHSTYLSRYTHQEDWSLREQLSLVSAVAKHGRSWKKIADIMLGYQEKQRPAGWFSAANCCQQFTTLAEPLGNDPAIQEKARARALAPQLQDQYQAYLEAKLPLANQKSIKKQKELQSMISGSCPEKILEETYDKFLANVEDPMEVFSENDEYTDESESDEVENVECEETAAEPCNQPSTSTVNTSTVSVVPATGSETPVTSDDEIELIDLSESPEKQPREDHTGGVVGEGFRASEVDLLRQQQIALRTFETQSVIEAEADIEEVVVIEERQVFGPSQLAENGESASDEPVVQDDGNILVEYMESVEEMEQDQAPEFDDQGMEVEGAYAEAVPSSPQKSTQTSLQSSPEKLPSSLTGQSVSPLRQTSPKPSSLAEEIYIMGAESSVTNDLNPEFVSENLMADDKDVKIRTPSPTKHRMDDSVVTTELMEPSTPQLEPFLPESDSVLISEVSVVEEEEQTIEESIVMPEVDSGTEEEAVLDNTNVSVEKMEVEDGDEEEEPEDVVDDTPSSGANGELENAEMAHPETSFEEECKFPEKIIEQSSDQTSGVDAVATALEEEIPKQVEEVFEASVAVDHLEVAEEVIPPGENMTEITQHQESKRPHSSISRQSETSVDSDSEKQAAGDQVPQKKKRKRGSRLQALFKEASTFFPTESFQISESATPEAKRLTRARRTNTPPIHKESEPQKVDAEVVVVDEAAVAKTDTSSLPNLGINVAAIMEVLMTLTPKIGVMVESSLPDAETVPSDQVPKAKLTQGQKQLKDKMLSALDTISSLKEAMPLVTGIQEKGAICANKNLTLQSLKDKVKSDEVGSYNELTSELALMLLHQQFLHPYPGLKVLYKKVGSILGASKPPIMSNEVQETAVVPMEPESSGPRSRLSSTSSSSTATPNQKGTKRSGRSAKPATESNKRGLRSSSASKVEKTALPPPDPIRNPNTAIVGPSSSPRPSASITPATVTVATRNPRKAGSTDPSTSEGKATRDLRSRRSTRGN